MTSIKLPALLLAAVALAAQAQTSEPATAASSVSSPAKKELVQKVLQLQQGAIEGMSRVIVERPVAQLAQAAGNALQTQVSAERREAVGKALDADLRKFMEEAVPILRERALKLAPSTFGATLEEKFTEDELRQLVAWLESPVNRKFQQALPELQNSFMQKLGAEAGTLLNPKLQALEQKMRVTLGLPSPGAAASGATSRPSAAPKASK